jgi:anti-sigma regulatory factor (Ser/Thr protein kinase)
MTDTIVLTIPTGSGYRGIATLVLGGVGSRLDLPYERMDDLQLAVLSMLEAASDGEVNVEIVAGDDDVSVSIGPLAAGSGADAGLGLVLSRLVDGVEAGSRSGDEWLTIRLARPQAATPENA